MNLIINIAIKIIEIKNDLLYEKEHLKQLKQYEIELNCKKEEFENIFSQKFTFQKATNQSENKENEFKFTQTQRMNYQRIKQRIKICKRQINKYEFEIIRNKKEQNMIENNKILNEMNKYEIKFNNKNDGKYLLNIVQTYGTKQAIILEYIKQLYANKNNKIIIFSLFGQTLNTIRNRLLNINVNCVLCIGNVHMRKKAMAYCPTLNKSNNIYHIIVQRNIHIHY